MTKNNNIDMFRECEIKYKIKNQKELNSLRRSIKKQGYNFVSRKMERDFLPDVQRYLCRKKGVLLRFRNIQEKDSNEILLTMKIKGKAKKFQEYHEMEYLLSNFKEEIFLRINSILKKITKIELPKEVNQIKDFSKLVKFIKNLGFDQHRILLEKKRETYINKDSKITIDLLPEGIGYYMEIETNSPKKLRKIIENFKLPDEDLITMDYGDILKEHKKSFPEIERRTGVF